MKRMRATALVLALAAALIVASAACGEREPQEHVFNLELRGGELVQDTSTWQVKQDDKVTMIVRSDQPVNFHLHGYDFEEDIEPGEPAEFAFTANATGSFPITIHLAPPGADDHDAGHAAGIEAPEGMSVSVEAEPDSVSGINVRLKHDQLHVRAGGVRAGSTWRATGTRTSTSTGSRWAGPTVNTIT